MERSCHCTFTILLLVVGGCGSRNGQPGSTTRPTAATSGSRGEQAESASPTTATATSPPGLVLVAPAGFEEQPDEPLFYHPKLRASIRPAHQSGADFDKVMAEFTAESLKGEGIAVKERVIMEVRGTRTLFVKGDRLMGKSREVSAIVLFPTKEGCAQLVAIYPVGLPVETKQAIDSAILNAQYNE